MGYFLGIIAMGVDIQTLINTPTSIWRDKRLTAMICFYLTNTCWNVVYDTVYAQQDVEDDAKAGVKSMAVRFRNYPKALLWFVASLQVVFLSFTGALQDLSSYYFAFACGGYATSLGYMLLTIDLGKPDECAWWFKNNSWLPVALGIGVESLQRC
jgi:4-hydroxybenzoate polyprenyltransferase